MWTNFGAVEFQKTFMIKAGPHTVQVYTTYIYVIYVYSVHHPTLVVAARPQVGFHFITCHSIGVDETKTHQFFKL